MYTQYAHNDIEKITSLHKPWARVFFQTMITISAVTASPMYNAHKLRRVDIYIFFSPTLRDRENPTLSAQARSQERHGVSRSQPQPVYVPPFVFPFKYSASANGVQLTMKHLPALRLTVSCVPADSWRRPEKKQKTRVCDSEQSSNRRRRERERKRVSVKGAS